MQEPAVLSGYLYHIIAAELKTQNEHSLRQLWEAEQSPGCY